ncbi:hypothetical protein JW916_13095 [Candidatus Sumerlaeota bacterium]|nr:hypothetical protein [Candidatus Sumerlaeota bacterium]
MTDEEKKREPVPPTENVPENSGLSGGRRSIWVEFFEYLMENKKWWLLPILLAILLFMAILVLSASPAGIAIYTLF